MDGKGHDRAIQITTPLFGAIAFIPSIPAQIPIIAGVAYFLGGYYLSPDLDTESRPTNRWGIFKGYWALYRRLPHRSPISHTPITGTVSRLLYLFGPAIISAAIASPLELLQATQLFWVEIITAIISVELSAWTHLYCDEILFRYQRENNRRKRQRNR